MKTLALSAFLFVWLLGYLLVTFVVPDLDPFFHMIAGYSCAILANFIFDWFAHP